MTFYIFLSLSAFLLALLGTRMTILAMRERPMSPDVKALMEKTLPPIKGGGIAVVFSLLICLLVADISYGVVLSLFLLIAIGVLHDLISIPLPIRLLVQVMAVTVPLSMTASLVFDGMLPTWLDKGITALLWLLFLNSFRAADRLEGLAASSMVALGGGVALLSVMHGTFPDALSTFGLIAAAAAAGFLWWNWPPAKILMGDVGAIPIGFLLGYLLLLAALSGHLYAALILPAYHIADSVITFFRRQRAGDSTIAYYYQQALQNGRRPEAVVRYITGINILLVFLAVRSVIDPDIALFHLSLSYMTVFMLLGFFAHTRPAAP